MRRWILGWVAGVLVVGIAAGLLVSIILLCRRIVSQAGDITRALDAAREKTTALFAVTDTNAAIDSITHDLRAVRQGMESQ